MLLGALFMNETRDGGIRITRQRHFQVESRYQEHEFDIKLSLDGFTPHQCRDIGNAF